MEATSPSCLRYDALGQTLPSFFVCRICCTFRVFFVCLVLHLSLMKVVLILPSPCLWAIPGELLRQYIPARIKSTATGMSLLHTRRSTVLNVVCVKGHGTDHLSATSILPMHRYHIILLFKSYSTRANGTTSSAYIQYVVSTEYAKRFANGTA